MGQVYHSRTEGAIQSEHMDECDLSIIIVSYNTAALTLDCLRATFATLAATAPDVAFEIFVVDNASADGSAARVRDTYGKRLHVIANSENVGFAAANNQALALARGRYLLLLNPDTVPQDAALVTLVRYLDANPHVGAAGPALLYPDGSPQECAFRFPTPAQLFLDFFPLNWRLTRSWLNGRYPQAWLAADHPPFAIDFPLGACLLTRRAVVEQIGPMDADFFIYMEEIDWCLRMKAAGWGVACVPEARVVHVGGASTRQFRGKMFVQLQKSRALFFRKHWSPAARAAARAITRAAMLWYTVRDYDQYKRSRFDWAGLRERAATYGQVWRLQRS